MIIFNSRNPLFNSMKMLHKAGGPSSAGYPQGSWIHHCFFRLLLTIVHQKDVPLDARDSRSNPTRPPAALSTVGPQQKYGVHVYWVQQQRPEAAAEMWLAAPSWLVLLAKLLSCLLLARAKAHPSAGRRDMHTCPLGHVQIHLRMLHHCPCQGACF